MRVMRIVEAVSAVSGVSVERLLGARRGRAEAHPRQMAMHLARQLTGRSLPEIGRALKRDHSTVIHGARAVDDRLARRCPETLRLRAGALAALAGCAPTGPTASTLGMGEALEAARAQTSARRDRVAAERRP